MLTIIYIVQNQFFLCQPIPVIIKAIFIQTLYINKKTFFKEAGNKQKNYRFQWQNCLIMCTFPPILFSFSSHTFQRLIIVSHTADNYQPYGWYLWTDRLMVINHWLVRHVILFTTYTNSNYIVTKTKYNSECLW